MINEAMTMPNTIKFTCKKDKLARIKDLGSIFLTELESIDDMIDVEDGLGFDVDDVCVAIVKLIEQINQTRI